MGEVPLPNMLRGPSLSMAHFRKTFASWVEIIVEKAAGRGRVGRAALVGVAPTGLDLIRAVIEDRGYLARGGMGWECSDQSPRDGAQFRSNIFMEELHMALKREAGAVIHPRDLGEDTQFSDTFKTKVMHGGYRKKEF